MHSAATTLQGKPWTFATFFSGLRWTRPLAGRAVLLLLVATAGG